tara:strand:+ start:1510 stop:2142 length:633 start_codon:yes stop_codon:yes gene_type:complete
MADIDSILDSPSTGGATYYDMSEDKPKVPMPEGTYPAHIVEVQSAKRTVKVKHQAVIYNLKVKIAGKCDAHAEFDALSYDGDKVTVNGADFEGRLIRSNGVFKFLHPSEDDEFEANPGGNKGYANMCTVLGKEPIVKTIELNGDEVEVKELPELTEDDFLGKPVLAVVGRGKPWKGTDGKMRTPYEVKWFRTWADGDIIDVDAAEDDLPF